MRKTTLHLSLRNVRSNTVILGYVFLVRMKSHESRQKKNHPGQLFHTKIETSNEQLAFSTST